MPNWTYNVIEMDGIGRKRSLFSTDKSGNMYFDFNKLIPEPKTAEECIRKYGEKYIDHGDCALMHTEDDSWFNWYDWHCGFWGTKWNSVDTLIEEDWVAFDTAWSAPGPIFIALSKKYPKEKIRVYSDYEDGFKTESVYLGGKEVYYKELAIDNN